MAITKLKHWLDKEQEVNPILLKKNWKIIPFFGGINADNSKKMEIYFGNIPKHSTVNQFLFTYKFLQFQERDIEFTFPLWDHFWKTLLQFNLVTDDFKSFIIFKNWADDFSQLFIHSIYFDSKLCEMQRNDIKIYNDIIINSNIVDKNFYLSRYTKYDI